MRLLNHNFCPNFGANLGDFCSIVSGSDLKTMLGCVLNISLLKFTEFDLFSTVSNISPTGSMFVGFRSVRETKLVSYS